MSCDLLRPQRPDAKPFIEEIDIASDGKLWVEVIRESGNRWEVFDAEGRLVAGVPVPTERHHLLPPAVNADHMLTVRRGDPTWSTSTCGGSKGVGGDARALPGARCKL